MPEQEMERVELEYTDKFTGKLSKARLRARIIEAPKKEKKHIIKKEDPPAGTEIEDRFVLSEDQIVQPPYGLQRLSQWVDLSTELGQNIRTIVTNTTGFGWQLKEVPIPDSIRKDYASAIEEERFLLEAKLSTIHAKVSLQELREREVFDKHSCGNGYLEILEDRSGAIVGLAHIRGYLVKLLHRDKKPTLIKVPRVRRDQGFKIEDVDMQYRFRRYCIILSTGSPVYFREAGDPRILNKKTGKYDNDTPFEDQATALIHNAVYNPLTPYGVPVWVGASVAVAGSRESEEVNYDSITHNMIPSMFVVVENGILTDGSVKRLKEWMEKNVAESKNRSQFIILEGDAGEDGALDPGHFRIHLEPLTSVQHSDQLYQEYDSNNRDKVRQSFRIPPIFVGRAEDYNRATSDTAKVIADEQVFAPERTRNDYLINRFVMLPWGTRFHEFKSNHPNVTNDIELIRMMGIAERSGGMTPRRADRLMRDVFPDGLGPMPEGVDLDVPFSITFAETQKAQPTEPNGNGKSDDRTKESPSE
jgi:PBSX family phage portal protein